MDALYSSEFSNPRTSPPPLILIRKPLWWRSYSHSYGTCFYINCAMMEDDLVDGLDRVHIGDDDGDSDDAADYLPDNQTAMSQSGDTRQFHYYSTTYLGENGYHTLQPNVVSKELHERTKCEVMYCVESFLKLSRKSTLDAVTMEDIFRHFLEDLMLKFVRMTRLSLDEVGNWVHVCFVQMMENCSLADVFRRSENVYFRQWVHWPNGSDNIPITKDDHMTVTNALLECILGASEDNGWQIDHSNAQRHLWTIENLCKQSNQEVAFGPMAMLEVDDDQISNASKGLQNEDKEDGRIPFLQKRNDKKNNPVGTTSHVMANRLLNMHVGFTWHMQKESTFDCMKRLFDRLDIRGGFSGDVFIDCDRQYTTNDFLDWLDQNDFRYGGTKKRKSGHAFTYGADDKKGEDERRTRKVPMSGAAHDYWAKTKDKERYHVAFRQATGTDKVCLAITNQKSLMGGWTFHFGKQVASRLEPYYPDVRELTYEQSSNPAWFYLRRGIITSSTAVHFLRLARRCEGVRAPCEAIDNANKKKTCLSRAEESPLCLAYANARLASHLMYYQHHCHHSHDSKSHACTSVTRVEVTQKRNAAKKECLTNMAKCHDAACRNFVRQHTACAEFTKLHKQVKCARWRQECDETQTRCALYSKYCSKHAADHMAPSTPPPKHST